MSKVESLEKYLNFIFVSTTVLPDGSVIEKRELIDKIGNLRIEIYPNEHPPPHFHVRCSEFNVSIDILSGEIIKGELTKKSRKKIQYFQESQREKLIAAWNELRPTDCPVGKIEI